MSAADPSRADLSGFSARAVLALVVVGVVALSALAVFAAYAPELRGGFDARAHALSPSAIGYKGAVTLARGLGMPVVVGRSPPSPAASGRSILVLTPEVFTGPKALARAAVVSPTLVVLPKWAAVPKPDRPGFVLKEGLAEATPMATAMLSGFAPETRVDHRRGVSRPILRGGGPGFSPGTYLPLGPVDRLQTLSGAGWRPALVDETGAAVLAESVRRPGLFVLADPDLLNTQGLASLDNARAGMAILQALRAPDRGVVFDVTLNGFSRGRGLFRTLLQPPWLAATLCGAAAAVLMGLHALARFGPAQARGRAVALGAGALVDSSAGLVRMARREAELTPAYAELTRGMVLRAAGHRPGSAEDEGRWLARLASARGAAAPGDLEAQAAAAKDRDAALEAARRLYRWRREMTRGRR